ncbi:MAG: HAD family phosphatase [Chitinophagaceae bacterium]|nr:HAD family phosphatase [Chitinophagaceae bacterium]
MYKAVFTDMDGTLLQNDHTISNVTQSIIQQLLKKGIMVVPVSARPLHAILPITSPVIDKSMPVVSLNGSYIFHMDEVLRDVRIPIADATEVHDEIQPYLVTPMYYNQMLWYSNMNDEIIRKEQLITDVKIIIQPFELTREQWIETDNSPNKIMIAGEREVVSEVQAKLRSLYGEKLNIATSQPRYLEVMNREASKKTGIQFLLDRFGLKREEVIAIGDNFNDKDMIEYAGMGIAMGNAPDEIKQVADYVTDTNTNDGVAKALQHFFF